MARCRPYNFHLFKKGHYKSRILESMVSLLQPVFITFVIFSWKNTKQGHASDLAYLYT